MSLIKSIKAREILDSRGNPTVEADVYLDSGVMGRASVPSGASTGSREALELRDNDKQRYLGKGVLKAVRHIHELIQPRLIGQTASAQTTIDNIMIQLDNTENKGHLGANAMLAVSLAVARAAANDKQLPLYWYLAPEQKKYRLPVPLMNIINGGAHADNQLDIQEFMIVPVGAPNFSEALRYGAEIFHALKAVLKKAQLGTNVGDEGGFAPALRSHREALDMIMQAIAHTGLQAGQEIMLALDAASSEFYRDGRYHLAGEGRVLNNVELTDYWTSMAEQYPIISIEDGMAEDDWDGWILLTRQLGTCLQLVGDDLFVTNTRYLEQGTRQHAANAILIKLNQIGTLTETLATMRLAQSAEFATIVSHRSGETEDAFIADLAVATGAGQIKTGSLCRTDRVAKYNQLLRLEQSLGTSGFYAGRNAFAGSVP